MPSFTLNGIEVPFKEGETIIQAADRAGIFIPRFCYHPALEIEGNCRMCLVDIEGGPPKLFSACSTQPKDGWIVHSNNEKVRKARAGILEFILINHPLDCPICDQAGECDLQDYAYLYGLSKSRYKDDKEKKPKHKILGPTIIHDAERCVLCSRCIRFLRDVVGTGELGLFERGAKTYVDIYPGKQIDNPYSGNLVDLCPVGALTSRDFRFKARAWDLDRCESVCPDCSTGCNIYIDSIEKKVYNLQYQVYRIRARANTEVNGYFICDAGRYDYKWLNGDERLWASIVSCGDHRDKIRTAAAIEQVAEALKKVVDQHGPSSVAGIGNARSTNEENLLLKKLIQDHIKSPHLDFVGAHGDVSEMEDNMLVRKDKNPNSKGCQNIGMAPGEEGRDLDGILDDADSGDIKALVVLSVGYKMPEDVRSRIARALEKVEVGVLIDCMDTELAHKADWTLASVAYAETHGTYTNYAGRVQRLQPTMPLGGEARPGWELLRDLLNGMGAVVDYPSAWAVTREMLENCPAYEGLTLQNIGPQGAIKTVGRQEEEKETQEEQSGEKS